MIQLPRKVEYEFMDYHITQVWVELNGRFGFDIKKWKIKFASYSQKHPRYDSVASAFNHFGFDEINPILNKILCRNEMYPTFNNLVEYVVKKR